MTNGHINIVRAKTGPANSYTYAITFDDEIIAGGAWECGETEQQVLIVATAEISRRIAEIGTVAITGTLYLCAA